MKSLNHAEKLAALRWWPICCILYSLSVSWMTKWVCELCVRAAGQVEWTMFVTDSEEKCWHKVTNGRINPRSNECTKWNDAPTCQWFADADDNNVYLVVLVDLSTLVASVLSCYRWQETWLLTVRVLAYCCWQMLQTRRRRRLPLSVKHQDEWGGGKSRLSGACSTLNSPTGCHVWSLPVHVTLCFLRTLILSTGLRACWYFSNRILLTWSWYFRISNEYEEIQNASKKWLKWYKTERECGSAQIHKFSIDTATAVIHLMIMMMMMMTMMMMTMMRGVGGNETTLIVWLTVRCQLKSV